MVLLLRFADRVGKGLRTAPRDALLALTVDQQHRGLAFGLNRALDNVGAVVGPLTAARLLAEDMPLKQAFLWAALGGANFLFKNIHSHKMQHIFLSVMALIDKHLPVPICDNHV